MKHMEYFKPYEGEKPFIFISYAHKDWQAVMEIVTDMHERGFRIWYDEGIEVGSEWTECIASHLAEASLMIGFVTEGYMESDNCRREMNYAVQKKKKIINIYLEPTKLTPGMELQIGGIWALMKYTFPSEEHFYMKLYEAPVLRSEDFGTNVDAIAISRTEADIARQTHVEAVGKTRVKTQAKPEVLEAEIVQDSERSRKRKRRKTRIIASVLAFLVLAVGALWFVGKYTGFIDRLENKYFPAKTEIVLLPGDTIAQFRSGIFEQVARDYCAKAEGDISVAELGGLTSLYICGDQYSFTGAFAGLDARSSESEATVTDASGTELTVTRGELFDLSDLKYFVGLTRLEISFQSLTALDTLPVCGIEGLNVTGNSISSLKGVGNLPGLTELYADGNLITEIGDLGSCSSLTTLYMNGANPNSLSSLKGLPALAKLRLSDCTYAELKPVLISGYLTELELYNCDLKGDVFDMLDGKRLSIVKLYDCRLNDIGDIDKLKASELWLVRCSGVADWSAISACTNLKTLHIDETMGDYFKSDYAFELVLEG